MPIDPNVLTPTLIKPLSVAGVVHDAAVVQEAQARAQAYRDKQMEVARDRQENDQIRGILQQSGGQLDDQTFAAIRQVSVPKAMDIEKLHNDSVKSSFEIDNSKIDHDLKVLGYTSRQLAGVTDQHSYDMARAGIKATTGQDLPEQYDPALVQSWQEKGMTYAEKLSQQREDRAAKFQELTATRQQAAEDRQTAQAANTERHQTAMEAIARGNLGVALGNLNLRKQELNKPGAAASAKPPTGAQLKTLGYFNRAKQASDDIDAIADKVAAMSTAEQLRMKYAPNLLQTNTGQSYMQAQRAFTEARLRKDSGAAIPEQEFENDRRTYFIQPGDSKDTIAQKTRARAAILASLGYESGSALHGFYGDGATDMIDEYRKIAARPAQGATPTKKANPFR